MFKQLVLCLAVLSLICVVHCTPTPVIERDSHRPWVDKREKNRPSSRPWSDSKRDRSKPSPKPWSDSKRDRSKPSPKPWSDSKREKSKPSPKPWSDSKRERSKPSPKPWSDSKRERPSNKPRSDALVARGFCDFRCPLDNLAGSELTAMYTDSGRLNCKYSVNGAEDNGVCVYSKDTGKLESGCHSGCDQWATFQCTGTNHDQEDMNGSPSPPKDSRSVNLPQFVKARSLARRAAEEDTA